MNSCIKGIVPKEARMNQDEETPMYSGSSNQFQIISDVKESVNEILTQIKTKNQKRKFNKNKQKADVSNEQPIRPANKFMSTASHI